MKSGSPAYEGMLTAQMLDLLSHFFLTGFPAKILYV
jgi:hypothetical protein